MVLPLYQPQLQHVCNEIYDPQLDPEINLPEFFFPEGLLSFTPLDNIDTTDLEVMTGIYYVTTQG